MSAATTTAGHQPPPPNIALIERVALYLNLAFADSSTLIKLDDAGNELPIVATDWTQVLDPATQMIWPRKPVPCTWLDCDKVAAECAVGRGGDETIRWFVPTLKAQISVMDYTRFDPALDTRFFDGPSTGFLWTASRVPANPHGYAFGVYLNDGVTDWNYQSDKGLLLPCRPAPRARQ